MHPLLPPFSSACWRTRSREVFPEKDNPSLWRWRIAQRINAQRQLRRGPRRDPVDLQALEGGNFCTQEVHDAEENWQIRCLAAQMEQATV